MSSMGYTNSRRQEVISAAGSDATTGTLNALKGRIKISPSDIAAGATDEITITNNRVKTDSLVLVSVTSYTGDGVPHVAVKTLADNTITLTLANVHGSAAFSSNTVTIGIEVIN